MRTIFLGSYGFGNLGDELCLIEALNRFGREDAWAFSSNPDYTQKMTGVSNFIQKRAQIAQIQPGRIVLGGGGVGFWPSLRDSLHWMSDGLRFEKPAELHVHNIGVGKITATEWFEDSAVKHVLANLDSFTVRDHVSRWLVQEWGFGLDPGITFYPEVSLNPVPIPSITLPPGRNIGISITGQHDMIAALDNDRDKIKMFVESLGQFNVVPIVSTVLADHVEEDDIRGFNEFAQRFLPGRPIVLNEMLDHRWREQNLTPLGLKWIISKLDLLLSQRKHNVIHAIGSRVPVVGIFPDLDDSILRIFFSLRHKLPLHSSVISLRTGRLDFL